MFREVVRKVKEGRKITTKALSDQTRISPNHISKFLSGERDVTTETLSRLVEGMEQLSPGAEKDFFSALTNVTTRPTFRQIASNMEPEELLEALEGEIFADLIHAFANTLKESRQPDRQTPKSSSSQKTKLEPTSTKTYTESLVS